MDNTKHDNQWASTGGGILGSLIGSLFGPIGTFVGNQAGSGIGSIFGDVIGGNWDGVGNTLQQGLNPLGGGQQAGQQAPAQQRMQFLPGYEHRPQPGLFDGWGG